LRKPKRKVKGAGPPPLHQHGRRKVRQIFWGGGGGGEQGLPRTRENVVTTPMPHAAPDGGRGKGKPVLLKGGFRGKETSKKLPGRRETFWGIKKKGWPFVREVAGRGFNRWKREDTAMSKSEECGGRFYILQERDGNAKRKEGCYSANGASKVKGCSLLRKKKKKKAFWGEGKVSTTIKEKAFFRSAERKNSGRGA